MHILAMVPSEVFMEFPANELGIDIRLFKEGLGKTCRHGSVIRIPEYVCFFQGGHKLALIRRTECQFTDGITQSAADNAANVFCFQSAPQLKVLLRKQDPWFFGIRFVVLMAA